MFNNKYKFNNLFFLNTLILLVVFVLGGCFAKEIKQVKSNPQALVVEKKVEAESENQEVGIEKQGEKVGASNWLTYRSEELGFEVKYPNTLIITDFSDTKDMITENNPKTLLVIENRKIDGYLMDGDLSIGIVVYTSNKSIKDWFQEMRNYKADDENINETVDFMKKIDSKFKKEYVISKTTYDDVGEKIYTFFSCEKPCSSEGVPYTNKKLYIKKGNLIYNISAIFSTNDYNMFFPIVDKIISDFSLSAT